MPATPGGKAGPQEAAVAPDPVLSRAATLSVDDLRHLADLEWRSRTQAREARLAAHAELAALGDADAAVARMHLLAIQRATTVAEPAGVERGTLAAAAIADAVVGFRLEGRLSKPSRSFLVRAWRRLVEDLDTPLTTGRARA